MRRVTALALAAAVLCATAGCGKKPVESTGKIQLIEPVDVGGNTETVQERNLYDFKLVSGYIYPYTEEYAFAVGGQFLEYAVRPGDQVKKGDLLASMNDENLLQQIEQMEEEIDQAKENIEQQKERYAELNKELNNQITNLKNQKNASGTASDAEKIKEIDGQIELLTLKVTLNQNKSVEEERLYQLDSAYKKKQLDNLKDQKQYYKLYATIDGEVVSGPNAEAGDWLNAGTAVIGIADVSQKLFKSESINKNEIKKCEDIYLTVNGERYSVTYRQFSAEEASRIKQDYAKEFSEFTIDDPKDQIRMGDYGMLTEMFSRREKVLSVPKSAIHKDELGSFVYCMQDKNPVLTYIKTGLSDGVYTEVKDGVKAGDEILLAENAAAFSEETVTVKRGNFAHALTEKAELQYKSMTEIKQEIKWGTVYLSSLEIGPFQMIKKGDTIAKIKVVLDDAVVYEKNLQIKRLEEQLGYALLEENEFEIENLQTQLDAVKEERKEMDEAAAMTEIRSPISGKVMWPGSFSENAIVHANDTLCYIADENDSALQLDNEKALFNYGNKVTVQYTDMNRKKQEIEGTIVTVGSYGLSRGLAGNTSYIRLPDGEISKLSESNMGGGFGFFQQWAKFDTTMESRKMDNILLVPKTAVEKIGSTEYVYIRQEDGTVKAQSIITGGNDDNNYWVLEGLEEGMKLCSK